MGTFEKEKAEMLARKAKFTQAEAAAQLVRDNAAKLQVLIRETAKRGLCCVDNHEVHGTAAGGGMVLHWGFTGDKGIVRISLVKLDSVRSMAVYGSAAAIKASIRLFVEGDEGNEHLYRLAEPLQPDLIDFRFIP